MGGTGSMGGVLGSALESTHMRCVPTSSPNCACCCSCKVRHICSLILCWQPSIEGFSSASSVKSRARHLFQIIEPEVGLV